MDNLEVGRQRPRRWPDGSAAPQWTPERLFALFPNLGEMPQRPGGRMSGGEQQMLTVARTLMGQPLLVLLDEPSEGVAPLIVEQMARTIRALKAQGVSVLLSEQNLPFAEAVADRAYLAAGAAQRPGSERPEVRLRPGGMRRLRGADRRCGGTVVLHPAGRRGRACRHHAGRPGAGQAGCTRCSRPSSTPRPRSAATASTAC
jgi:ABC-type nitrate/sulfonate/bicarbonate transport system ATPase subunit